MKKHQKHSALVRPELGHFARLEWAFVGAPCSDIQDLCSRLASACAPSKVAWVDADHAALNNPADIENAPFFLHYDDHQTHVQIRLGSSENPFEKKAIFQQSDAAFVNGNHFQAQRQIVLVHSKKEASLKKRLEQLTQVEAVVLMENELDIFDFLKEKLPENTPIFRKNEDWCLLVAWMKDQLEKTKPILNGLVLAGGKSQRMGFDKTKIKWHGKEQTPLMADHLNTLCDTVYLSVRPDQMGTWTGEYPLLHDQFLGIGPLGGILSAFQKNPNAAWLVVASDLPFLDAETLGFLVQNRNSSAAATAFRSPKAGENSHRFPEPLIAIYEPKCYPLLLQMLAFGYSCPRKTLINFDTHLVEAPNPMALSNVNTPEEYDVAHRRLKA